MLIEALRAQGQTAAAQRQMQAFVRRHGNTPQARAYPDGRIWHVITRGQNKMPTYADILTPTERWQVVHWIRVMQLAKKKAEAE